MSTTSAPQSSGGVTKLRVFQTVGHAYSSAFSNLGAFIKIAWFWMLVILALSLIYSYFLPARFTPTDPREYQSWTASDWMLLVGLGFVSSLVYLPFLSSIAVNWHRMILLGERPVAGSAFRLDGPVWAYVAAAVVLAVARFAATAVQFLGNFGITSGSPGVTPSFDKILFQLAGNLVFLAALMFIGRLSIALPARAIGHDSVGFGDVWAATRRNTWRIAWGFVLCFLPLIVLGIFAFSVWPGQAGMLGTTPIALGFRVISGVIGAVLSIVGVGYLSFVYLHFFPKPADTA